MNRELKFRIWTGERMEYSIGVSNYGAFFCGGIDPKDSASLGFTTLYSKDYQVMQHTGLNDRNGTGIYEGDIVVDKQSLCYKVIYDSKYARFDLTAFGENKVSGRSYFTQVYEGKLLEVVGNVFGMPATLGVQI